MKYKAIIGTRDGMYYQPRDAMPYNMTWVAFAPIRSARAGGDDIIIMGIGADRAEALADLALRLYCDPSDVEIIV